MNSILVLEIGNPWLKMVVLRSALGATHVRGLSAVNVASLAEDAIVKSVADFLKDLKVKKPQSIIVSFSRNAVTLRNLRIPSINPSEIEDMIKLHVGRQVPYAKEEIVSGYRISGKDSMGYAKVMLAIVHRESIRKVFRILEKAGLYTDRVELSSDGILSWLSKSVKPADLKSAEAFIVLDIDATFTDFIVSTSENILFSRVITLGAEQLSDDSKWPKFIGEMKQTIVISQGEEVIQKPTRIYLSGMGTNLKTLSTTIEMELNLPCVTLLPLANLPVAKDLVKSPQDPFANVSFSALLGLGLDTFKKRINFVLPEAQIRKVLRERSRELIFLGAGIMYFILVICGIYGEKVHNQQAYLDLLSDRYKAIASDAEALNIKVERMNRIKTKLDTKAAVLNYIYEVSKLLPPQFVQINISFVKDEQVTLRGRAPEMSDVFKFVTTLENSKYFKDVQTRYTTRKKMKDKDVNEFEIICPVAGDKETQAPKKEKT
jgi:Tfp pilus assembly PilM family ATPase